MEYKFSHHAVIGDNIDNYMAKALSDEEQDEITKGSWSVELMQKNPGSRWVTIRGSKVLLGSGGQILASHAGLKEKLEARAAKKAQASQEGEKEAPKAEEKKEGKAEGKSMPQVQNSTDVVRIHNSGDNKQLQDRKIINDLKEKRNKLSGDKKEKLTAEINKLEEKYNAEHGEKKEADTNDVSKMSGKELLSKYKELNSYIDKHGDSEDVSVQNEMKAERAVVEQMYKKYREQDKPEPGTEIVHTYAKNSENFNDFRSIMNSPGDLEPKESSVETLNRIAEGKKKEEAPKVEEPKAKEVDHTGGVDKKSFDEVVSRIKETDYDGILDTYESSINATLSKYNDSQKEALNNLIKENRERVKAVKENEKSDVKNDPNQKNDLEKINNLKNLDEVIVEHYAFKHWGGWKQKSEEQIKEIFAAYNAKYKEFTTPTEKEGKMIYNNQPFLITGKGEDGKAKVAPDLEFMGTLPTKKAQKDYLDSFAKMAAHENIGMDAKEIKAAKSGKAKEAATKKDAEAQAAKEAPKPWAGAWDGKEISSTDPNAINKLKDKIDKLQANQELMKRANKLIDKNDFEGLKELGMSDKMIKEITTPNWSGRIGFPAYALQNNNQNINAARKRVEQLEKEQQFQPETKEIERHGVTVVDNVEENRIQLEFPGKPSYNVIQRLKGSGFRWSPSRGVWQAYRSAARHVDGILDLHVKESGASKSMTDENDIWKAFETLGI